MFRERERNSSLRNALRLLSMPIIFVTSLSASSSTQETFRQLRISFVTGNAMKAKEMNRILADHGATRGPTPETSMVDLRVLNVDLPEIQEVDTIAIGKQVGRILVIRATLQLFIDLLLTLASISRSQG